MLLRYNLTLAFALCCAVGLYMLGTEEVALPSATVANSESEESNTPKAKQDEQSSNDESTEPTENQPNATEAEQQSPEVAFQPPFPDRTNLFQAPKRQGRASSKVKGQDESAVELLGFVNVDGPRVALSIDGLVTTAAEGEKQFGIEVISIKPPAVLLQRGRQRWQATLEN